MDRTTLYSNLNYVDATRESRLKYAKIVLSQPVLIEPLLEILFLVDDKISSRAAWILEFVVSEDLSLILPHLDLFTKNLQTIKFESSLRPAAKICENLVSDHYIDTEQAMHHKLKVAHRQFIIEFCFDLLIGDHKVAPKVYSMTSLLLLSNEYVWIKDELRTILQRDYANQSAGYKARARMVLTKLSLRVEG